MDAWLTREALSAPRERFNCSSPPAPRSLSAIVAVIPGRRLPLAGRALGARLRPRAPDQGVVQGRAAGVRLQVRAQRALRPRAGSRGLPRALRARGALQDDGCRCVRRVRQRGGGGGGSAAWRGMGGARTACGNECARVASALCLPSVVDARLVHASGIVTDAHLACLARRRLWWCSRAGGKHGSRCTQQRGAPLLRRANGCPQALRRSSRASTLVMWP